MAYCDWFAENDLQRSYHEEWGTPVHDDQRQFEFLSLEVMQCGLSFGLILQRREILNQCFDSFDPEKVSAYGEADVQRILETTGMIRSEAKVRAIISNAKAFLQVQQEYGSFDAYLWRFSGYRSIVYHGHETGLVPASNGLSQCISKDLKQRGFRFLGPVVMYSFLQACGIINDHAADCPRRKELMERYPTIEKRRYQEKCVHQY